jgi:hypothetical protein
LINDAKYKTKAVLGIKDMGNRKKKSLSKKKN